MAMKNKVPVDWNKLSTYRGCMDHEQSVRSSYQSIILTIESILFSIYFVMMGTDWAGSYLLALPLLGIVFCGLAIVSDYRAVNVDRWRRTIIDLVEGTELEKDFKEGRWGDPIKQHPFYGTKTKRGKFGRIVDCALGHVIERAVTPLIFSVWVGFLFISIGFCIGFFISAVFIFAAIYLKSMKEFNARIKVELKKLEQLHEEGQVTPEEYQSKKKQLEFLLESIF